MHGINELCTAQLTPSMKLIIPQRFYQYQGKCFCFQLYSFVLPGRTVVLSMECDHPLAKDKRKDHQKPYILLAESPKIQAYSSLFKTSFPLCKRGDGINDCRAVAQCIKLKVSDEDTIPSILPLQYSLFAPAKKHLSFSAFIQRSRSIIVVRHRSCAALHSEVHQGTDFPFPRFGRLQTAKNTSFRVLQISSAKFSTSFMDSKRYALRDPLWDDLRELRKLFFWYLNRAFRCVKFLLFTRN